MNLKKLTAMLTIASLSTVCISVSAATSHKDATVTVTGSVQTIEAGSEITITNTYDTLVGSNGGCIFIAYDANSFETKSGKQSIKIGKKTYEFPLYFAEETLNAIGNETHILYGCFGTFNYGDDKNFKAQTSATNTYQQDMVDEVNSTDVDCVKFVYGDSSYAVTAEDEGEEMYPNNVLGVNFVAKDGIEAGTYTFAVYSYANDKSAVLTNYPVKTITVKVEGDDDDTPVATEGNSYNGRSTFYGTATNIPSGTSTITAEITKGDVTKTDTVETPSGVIGGKSKILPIVSYDSGTVSSGDVFTLILKNGTTEFGKWTYTVPEM